MDRVLGRLRELDELYEVMTLNHVSRRASKTQGVALLTLFSKGFSKPRLTKHLPTSDPSSVPESESRAATLLERLKFLVRREDTHGHLPVCWGVLTAALGLSSGAEIPLLQSRSRLINLSFLHRCALNRTKSVSSPVPASPQFAVRFCATEHHWAIRCTAVATPYRTTASRVRDVAMQAFDHKARYLARSDHGEYARGRGRRLARSGNDLASWRDSCCPPRSAAFAHFQQLSSTRASAMDTL